MKLVRADSISYINSLNHSAFPDVIYLDPMFPLRKKAAKFLFIANIIILLSFNLLINLYESKTAYAAKDIADYIKQNNITAQINFDIAAHNYYLLNDNPNYPLENRDSVLFAYGRPYIATDKSNLGKNKFTGEFEIVYESKVQILGINIKHFVIAKRK